jgi:cell division transport system permease protein
LISVLTIMALLAGLSLLFSRSTLRLSGDWQAQLSNSLTVQVTLAPISPENDFDTQMNAASTALKTLIEPAAKIDTVEQSDSQALIRPWIGNLELPDSLTLPGLITIEMPPQSQAPTASQLEQQLENIGILATVDDHSRWADKIKSTARRLVLAGGILLGLLLFAAVSVNLFATRAVMAAQLNIISVLAQVGATDRFVAKLFVSQAGKRSALAAGLGMMMAWSLWVGFSLLGLSPDLFWSNLADAMTDGMWLIGLWGLFTAVCALAAGLATRRALIADRRRA